MKSIIKSILLLSAVLFCFAGCSENAQTSENNIFIIGSAPNPSSSSSSDSENEVSSNDEISDSALNSSMDESAAKTSSNDETSYTPIDINDINHDDFDFTEDDLWVQSFMKENFGMAYFLYCMNSYGFYADLGYEDYSIDAEHKSCYYLSTPNFDLEYSIMSNVYFNTAEEFEALLNKYCFRNNPKMDIPCADIIDPEKGYISIRDWSEPYDPQIVEINGRLYHYPIGPGGAYQPRCDLAKVMSKTDDEIVFTYLCTLYNDEAIAGQGKLKKQNGEWKFGWSVYCPDELLDIHEVWGI